MWWKAEESSGIVMPVCIFFPLPMKKFLTATVAAIALTSVALPALAREAASGMATGKKAVDIACVKTALDVREDALMAGWSVFNTSIVAAYTARKSALDAAWVMTDAAARNAAVKAAWTAFKTAKQSAQKQWQSARKAAWKTFKSAAKACKVPEVDAGGEAMDQ